MKALLVSAYIARTGRKPGPIARWLISAVLLGATIAIAATAAAQDKPRAKRPTMCMTGQPVAGNGFAGWLCLDGKRPRIFTRYIEVKFVDSDGKPAVYVLGWTAPVVRTAKGGYVAEGTPRPAQIVKL